MEHFKYVHLWIGTSNKTEEEYYKYFEIDYSEEDFDSPNYKPCQFCKDIGEKWYDEDFIIIHTPLENEVDVKELLKQQYSTIDTSEYSKILVECKKHNISKANVLFNYAVSDNTRDSISIPHKNKNFNGLKYIGLFLHE